MSYTHFNKEDRIRLATLRKEGLQQKDIAARLGKHPSSVGRELRRNKNCAGKYLAGLAGKTAGVRQANRNAARKKISTDPVLVAIIKKGLKKYWSPEQIAGRLKRQNKNTAMIHHETIYQWIYGERPDLQKYLRCRKNKYRRKRGTYERGKRREEEKKKRIDKRPKVIETRRELGHWEGDTVIGRDKKHALVTHVERKSKYLMMSKVNARTAAAVRQATIARFKKIPKKKRKTETFDNGVEFSDYEMISARIDLDIYFAYPYHSWERGTNENTNGLARQFFPKGSNFILITDKQVQRAERLLNHRPRKCLSYQTPHEVFHGK